MEAVVAGPRGRAVTALLFRGAAWGRPGPSTLYGAGKVQ
ncbi:protein of unknown function [Kyrpidia spormannii]|uniref:Uncharacterized protein n=1 Tax=Kyrpidia spormannii TaxID=2055160 RepID=A0A6F9EIR7_9BACL|nr:protein of unknown function [Kyrpidia spormannii]